MCSTYSTMVEYKTIKVPVATYEAAQKIRGELIKMGIDKLPEGIVNPQKCPICGSKMEGFDVSYGYYRCPSCSYEYQSLKVNTAGIFALGAVIGLGIGALAYYLTKNKK